MMFRFLKNKREKLIEQTSVLVSTILDLLPDEYQELKSRENQTSIINALYVPNPDSGTVISIEAEYKQDFINSDGYKNGHSFELSGINIKNKKTGDMQEVILPIWHGRISNICFKVGDLDLLNYDVQKVNVEHLKSRELEYKNPDIIKLEQILKSIGSDELSKLEIEDTFEIETDRNTYFTIIDMENGNYIVVDKKERVYRLDNDNIEPEKRIYDNIKEFLNQYSGNKIELKSFFS